LELEHTIWEDIIGHVRVNHPKVVRAWFQHLSAREPDYGVLLIQAKNNAQTRYLKQHCTAAFVEAAQAATAMLISVEFADDGSCPESDGQECVSGAGSGSEDSNDPHGHGFNGRRTNGFAGGPSAGEHSPISFTAQRINNGDRELYLNSDYRFENLVVGPCNRLAHAASVAVAENPGQAYNPLFLHGASGLGKTHLLQAICQENRFAQSHPHIVYISCESFTNEFLESVERGQLYEFRHQYRDADALLIDDIQLLAERERSQEEFFHTFNTLFQSNRQIVLTADCPPSEIPSLEDRLVSRFNSGLVAVLDPPCYETRISIVRKKARLRGTDIPEDVARFIASRVERNIRDLEGALIRVEFVARTEKRPIDMAVAELALGRNPEMAISIPEIMAAVGERFKVKVSDLQSRRRHQSITRPRHLCMYLARRFTNHSLEEIGGYFGGRDHTTVMHAGKVIDRLLDEDKEFQQIMTGLCNQLHLTP
jgi:chromosomal replication initiator protein